MYVIFAGLPAVHMITIFDLIWSAKMTNDTQG